MGIIIIIIIKIILHAMIREFTHQFIGKPVLLSPSEMTGMLEKPLVGSDHPTLFTYHAAALSLSRLECRSFTYQYSPD